MKLLQIASIAALVASASAAQAFPIAAPGSEGFAIIAAGGGDVIATYQGNSASYSNDLYLVNTGVFIFNNHGSAVGATVNLGAFAAGTEWIFRLNVNDTGDDFYTGSPSRNVDLQAHARAQSNWLPGETLVSFEDLRGGPYDFNDLSFSFTNTAGQNTVPEPGSIGLLALACGLGLVFSRRRGA